MAEAAEPVEDKATEALAPEPVDDEPEWSPEAEEIAREMGWKPREEFDPGKGEWKSPREFISNTRKVLFDSRDKIKSYDGKFARIAAQMAKLQGNQRTQADQEAQARLAAAVEAGDFEAAKQVLQSVKATHSGDSDDHPALAAFKERNSAWWDVDEDATAYAAAQDTRIAKRDGITNPEAHMRKVEDAVKKVFPQHFGGSEGAKEPKGDKTGERPRAPLVARGGGGDRRSSDTLTVSTMTPEMRRAAAELGVKPESYVKSYNEMAEASSKRRFA